MAVQAYLLLSILLGMSFPAFFVFRYNGIVGLDGSATSLPRKSRLAVQDLGCQYYFPETCSVYGTVRVHLCQLTAYHILAHLTDSASAMLKADADADADPAEGLGILQISPRCRQQLSYITRH